MPRLGRTVTFGTALTVAGLVASGCASTASHDIARPKPVARATPHDRATTQFRDTRPKPVATIDDKTITLGHLERSVSIALHRQIGAPEPPNFTGCIEYLRSRAGSPAAQATQRLTSACRQRYGALLKSALSSLIYTQWLIAEATDEGLKVDKAKLKRETALSGPHGEEVRQALMNTGETVSDFKLKLTASQLSDRIYRRLERKVPTVTRARVSAYYAHHKTSFIVPERRDLHVLRSASDAAAKKARQEIESGESFAAIVKKTSLVQPDTSNNGLLLGLAPNNWPEPPLSREVFHAHLKTLIGPVKSSLGYYLFEVLRRFPARQRTLAEVKSEIAQQLHRLLRDRLFSRFLTGLKRKWAPRTNCRPGYVVKYCSDYGRPRKVHSNTRTPGVLAKR